MSARAIWLEDVITPNDRQRPVLPNVARGIAAFIGAFTLLSLISSLRSPTFDATHWWISADALPSVIWVPCLLISSLLLLAFACRPPNTTSLRRHATVLFAAVLLVITVMNGITFYFLLADGTITAGVPFPLSFLFSAA